MEVLSVSNLEMKYGTRTVLDNVSFKLNGGDYLLIVGDNGMGKSTLLKGILGLYPIASGSISLLGGTDKKDIGYLPQQKDIQKNFPCLVKEVIMSGFLNGKKGFSFFNPEEKKKAQEAAAYFGIENLLLRPYANLSGGQQQRVLIARAVCAAKTMLVLDEPAASLDADATKGLYEQLALLNKKGVTVIMVTHDKDNAIKYATHILKIGKESFFGTKDEYLTGGGTKC